MNGNIIRRTTAVAASAALLATVALTPAGSVAAQDCTHHIADWAYLDPVVEGVVLCGSSGDDVIAYLDGGVFLGGKGDDQVRFLTSGKFEGGQGADSVFWDMWGGTFAGGPGDDRIYGAGGTGMGAGTFAGGPGDDSITDLCGAYVCRTKPAAMSGGKFIGGPGNDSIVHGPRHGVAMSAGEFVGGPGNDTVDGSTSGGTCVKVESGCP